MDAAIKAELSRPPSALRRLMRRKLAVLGLLVIALVVGGALAAPLIVAHAPDEQMFDGLTLEGAPMPPGGAFLSAPTFWAAICSRASSMARARPW